MKIYQATMADYNGIFALHKTYHTDYIAAQDRPDGFVTTNFTAKQMEALVEQERGVTIAKDDDGRVVAYAMAASWSFWKEWPFFAYMIEKLPDYSLNGQFLSVENSYQYGPVCIHKSMRGTGLFEQVFYASLASMRDRYPIMVTFINQINHRSYAAHTRKIPMTVSGTFQFNKNDYYLLACPTSLSRKERL